jgi:drug/metabolite transporter (DMT)-like permease
MADPVMRELSGSHRQGILLLVLTALLWSSSGLLIKVMSWQPLAILSGRSILASLVFLAYLRQFPLRWTRWQVAGAISYIGTQLLFIMATKLTTAANAIFLQYTAPIYVILLGFWLLGERPQRADWMALPVIFAGLLLFFGDDVSWGGFYGNVVAIISGVAMAAMMVCMRRQKDGSPAQTILLGNLVGALIGLPFLLREDFSASNLGMIGYLGVFQIGLSFVFYSVAMKSVRALEAILILTLEPILNPIWVFLGIGEVPGRLALVGGMLVIGAVTVRAIIGAGFDAEESASVNGAKVKRW